MDLTPEQARTFVGPRADYYLERWSRIAPGYSRAIGFNWPAFFAGIFWLLYRRMHRTFWITGGILGASVVLEGLALGAAGVEEFFLLDMVLTVVIAATFGNFGTYWYYLHARRRVRLLAAAGRLSPETLAQDGGTSWLALAIGVAVISALMILALWADSQPMAGP